MKHTLLKPLVVSALAIVTCVVPFSLQAGEQGKCPKKGPGHARMSAEDRVQRMTEHLGLTAEQATAVQEVFESHREQFKQQRASGERPSRESMLAIRQAIQVAIDDILTEEQQTKLETVRKARREQRGARGPKRQSESTQQSETGGKI